MTRILITGAAGMVGRALAEALPPDDIVATDLNRGALPDHIRFRRMDVTGQDPETIIAEERPEVVVHLASIVTPPPPGPPFRSQISPSDGPLGASTRFTK